MPHLIAMLTLVMLFVGPASPRASEEGAAALLLDNEDLCLRIGGLSSGRETAAQAAAHALAWENLSIADELIASLPATAKRTQQLTEVLELQQRVCGELTDRNASEGANLEPELRTAGKRLAATIPVEGRRRDDLLFRFLDRREQATYAALNQVRARTGIPVLPVALPARLTNEARVGVEVAAEKAWLAGQETATGGQAAHALASQNESVSGHVDATANASGVGSDTGLKQVWDPSPTEMARRRQQRTGAFRERFERWRPTLTRELRELVALRSTLARELESRSLQHVQSLCGQLTGAVDRIEYEVVLSAPEPSVREFLDRMLASYAEAGRWCTSERFSFAWIEIEKADQRWRQLSARLAMLDAG